MRILDQSTPPSGPGRFPEDRLDSWKAIAAYLGRGVRTVQRWEREEGLPVHRLAHEKRGSVYADRREIDAWWESRRRTLASTPTAIDSVPSASGTAERITWMSAAVFWPAFSSDGRLLACVSDGGRDGAPLQIWLHQVGGAATCLTSGVRERSFLAFSSDDTRILFTATDGGGQHVYAIPTLGGAPRLVKRGARAGRESPDGKWLASIALGDVSGVRVASIDGATDRHLAADLLDPAFAVWSPDSRSLLVQAHADPAIETDFWLVPMDGGGAVETGILHRVREHGSAPLTFPAAWIGDAIVFSAITPRGVTVWRQRLAPGTWACIGEPEPLTRGHEMDLFVTAAGGRAAFISTHVDQNLWSLGIDPENGHARGPPSRLTRGPGVVSQLSVSHDGRLMTYFFGRPGSVGVMVRDLETGHESELVADSPADRGFPAISPSGRRVAFATRSMGPRVSRPIYVARLPDGESRKLGDDFGGRPRQWVDEVSLIVERFGTRLQSVAVLDTVTGEQTDVLASADHSITNARVSPDGRWIAFDAARPGAFPIVFVAPFRREIIPTGLWVEMERQASHPFWSTSGELLYYLPSAPSREIRNVLRARRFDRAAGVPDGDPVTAFASTEMVVPTLVTGVAPVATADRILLVLADFRGDVWAIDV